MRSATRYTRRPASSGRTATDGSLRYYWSRDGTSAWYGAQIAPPGTVSASPSMTRSNGGTEIAVAGL